MSNAWMILEHDNELNIYVIRIQAKQYSISLRGPQYISSITSVSWES